MSIADEMVDKIYHDEELRVGKIKGQIDADSLKMKLKSFENGRTRGQRARVANRELKRIFGK